MKLIDGTESIFGCRRRLQHSQKILPGVLGPGEDFAMDKETT